MPFGELGLPEESITNVLVQYWSCAQGRIVGVAEAIFRGIGSPIPRHLLRNDQVMDIEAAAFRGNFDE